MTGGTVPLKYRAEIMAGQSPASADVTDLDEGQPFLQGNAEFGPLHPTPRYQCDVAVKVAAKGDLLMSVRAPVGALNIADQTYGIGRGLCAIRPESVPHEYVWWWLHHAREELESVATGSTFSAVSAGQVGALPLPEMEPEYYHRVADFLDRETAQVDAMIAKQEELVGLLGERRSAVIAHAITKGLNPDAPMQDSGIEWLGVVPAHWDVRPLKRVGGLLTGSTPPTSQESNYSDEPNDLQWVRPEDLDNSGKPIEASKWLSAEGWRASRPVPAGSVLLCCIGATLGKVGIVDRASATNQQITAIQNTETPKFLFYVLHAAQQALWSVASGNTLPLLNNDKLGRVPVPWPEIHEREQIVAHLDDETRRLDLIVLRAKESIVLMRERRTALISDAVTGRLDIDAYGREREVVGA